MSGQTPTNNGKFSLPNNPQIGASQRLSASPTEQNSDRENTMSSTLKTTQSNLAATAEETKSRVSQHLGYARDDLMDGASSAREDLMPLGDFAQDYAHRAGEAVQRSWNGVKDSTRSAVSRSGDMARQHPIAALSIAVGVGFVLAKLMSSRR